MTDTLLDDLFVAPAGNAARFGGRWRLVSAGLANVWRYGELVLPASSGRLLLRGPNGTGKTTALEALWPFLLDLDRAKLRAGQSRTTTLVSLMREGHADRKRIGYAWLTLAGPDSEPNETVICSYGVRLVYSNGATPMVRVEPFTIPGEPLRDMALTGPGRTAITTVDAFREIVESAGGSVFADEADYVASLASHVFGTGHSDLLVLADRVRKVRNPSLLADTSAERAAESLREALPGVSNDVVEATGEALSATDETRAAFRRDEDAAIRLAAFADVWAGHAADVVSRIADEGQQAATALRDARATAAAKAREHKTAQAQAQQAVEEETIAEEALAQLQATIEALKQSPEYRTIDRLKDLSRTAKALTAESRTLTGAFADATSGIRQRSAQLREDAEQLTSEIDATARAAVAADSTARAVSVILLVTDQPPHVVGEQSFDPGPAVDVTAGRADLPRAGENWNELATGHETRAAGAEMMLGQLRKVDDSQREARRQREHAERAGEAAERAVQERERRTSRARATADEVGRGIAEWARDNRDLTEDNDSDPLDADAVAGVVAAGPAALIAAAQDWSATATRQAEISAVRADADADARDGEADDRSDQARQARTQAGELRAGRTLPPPRPDWAGDAGDEAFANALQWPDDVDENTRAHVESALASSGLLGATLGDDQLRTDAWQVSNLSPLQSRNLTTVVTVDPDHPRAEMALRVLERIGLAESAPQGAPDSGTVIGLDGTFRLGTILGRAPGTDDLAQLPRPSHVGAAQRRAAALAEAARLESAADALDTEASELRALAAGLRETARATRLRAAAFPPLRTLREHESQRASSAQTAAALRATADEVARDASDAESAARAAAENWRANVTAMGLPPDRERLAEARLSAESAARTLRTCAQQTGGQQHRLLRLLERADSIRAARADLPAMLATATTKHRGAEEQRRIYEQLEAEHGQSAADLVKRLQDADGQETSARITLKSAHADATRQRDALIRAEGEASHAHEHAVRQEPAAAKAAARLRELVSVPDVTETVLGGTVPHDDDQLLTWVREAVADLPRAGKKKVADTYEIARAELAGVWAVNRSEGFGDVLDTYQCTYDGAVLTTRAASALASELADRAREQLEESEESALRDFIIGRLPTAIGIAWVELRDWVRAVNQKMLTASASSGVGVQVKVSLRDDISPTQQTVYRLACLKSAAERSAEQDQVLAEALKTLLATADAETVTERVRQAVDIRDWVRVDYFVHRPGQEPKRWTRNTGLSGGERRLVILAPMLASIAALYDSLPETALRLTALDEVPAEVDERGREGLARYVAELDLDVICTSYLWDGAPGAWDGVDAHDLESVEGVVVAFPMLVRGSDPLPGDPELPS